MVWREDTAPGRNGTIGTRPTGDTFGSSSKVPVMMAVTSFLLVTIALVALQPRHDSGPSRVAETSVEAPAQAKSPPSPTPASAAETIATVQPEPVPEQKPVPAPVASRVETPLSRTVETAVTRSETSLLELQRATRSTQASDVLHQLATQGGRGPADLQVVARQVLAGFGYAARDGDRLHALLVGALSHQKSDAYIDALLNTAAARGEFSPPLALVMPTGRMDTSSLLRAMVLAARG